MRRRSRRHWRLGPEKALNGDFAVQGPWLVTGGTFGSGVVTFPGGSSTPVYQPMAIQQGHVYQITYTLVSCTAGAIAPVVGSGSFGTYRSVPGTYTEKVVGGTSVNGGLSPQSTAFAGVVDNFSCKEVLVGK